MKRISILLGTGLILVIFSSVFLASSRPVYNEFPEQPDAPSLKIKKWISVEDRVEPGELVTVNVNITNLGKKDAYNLTVEEPLFQNFTVENVKNFTPHLWVKIAPNATFSYSYQFKFEREGIFVIEKTTVAYTDIDGNEYTAMSGSFEVEVSILPPPESLEEQWRVILISIIAILAIPIVLFLINKYFFE